MADDKPYFHARDNSGGDLKKRFRRLCVEEDTTMADEILRMIWERVEKYEAESS